MKNLLESIRNMYAAQAEATMMQDDGKVVHNCAKHVEHAEWGQGNCISEEHADPDRYGNIAWYDVMFEHGLERGVPTAELNILRAESHMHSMKKAKKVAEALNTNAPVSIDPKQAIKKKAMDDALDAANKQGTTGEIDKIVHQGVTKEEKEEKFEADEVQAAGHKKTKEKYETLSKMPQRMKEDFDPVDETIIYKDREYSIDEADKNYDAYFRAKLKSAGKSIGDMSDEEKKAFFNKVDAGFKAKNEDVFLEAYMASDLMAVKDAHRKAGNKISNETTSSKGGQAHHSFVVTTPAGKRTRHIYHGSTKKVETMSAAPRSKEAKETGEDDDDK